MEGFVDVDSGHLFYRTDGEGPPVVLVHGFSLDLRMWDDQLSLPGRKIRYDLRGHGRSTMPTGRFAHERDLLKVVDALGLDTFDLIGLSLGGGIALDFALTNPKRLGSLVVADATLGGYTWPHTAHIAKEVWGAGSIEASRAKWLANPLLAPALENPASAGKVRRLIDEYSGWGWANKVPLEPLTPPAIGRLGELHVPTMVLVGELDDPDFRACSELIAKGVPGAESHVLPGVGHMSNMEAPEQFNALVAAFLSSAR